MAHRPPTRPAGPAGLRRIAACTVPLLLAGAVAGTPAAPGGPAAEVSAAERALFMSPHLAGVRPPAVLGYRFVRSGRLEEGFEDRVSLALTALPDGRCCHVQPAFLGGARQLPLPAVDAPEGNPVLLYFLERDVREMARLTGGQPLHFRRRIRLALAQAAAGDEVALQHEGRTLRGRRIVVAPYLDDPLRPRFERLAGKRYHFLLCDEVPGGIAALRTDVAQPGGEPLLVEELLLDGARVPPWSP